MTMRPYRQIGPPLRPISYYIPIKPTFAEPAIDTATDEEESG